jgi:preprotein translocase subunit YajC
MWDLAFAQTAPSSSVPGILATPLPAIALMFVVFYFLLIRPQQKKAKDHRRMLDTLKKNDEVMTSGGIYGKVVALTDTVATLEIAPNVRIRIHRPQISDILKGEKTVTKETKEP